MAARKSKGSKIRGGRSAKAVTTRLLQCGHTVLLEDPSAWPVKVCPDCLYAILESMPDEFFDEVVDTRAEGGDDGEK